MRVLSEAEWELIEPFSPAVGGGAGVFVITVSWWRGSSTGTGPGSPGATCRGSSDRGRPWGNVTVLCFLPWPMRRRGGQGRA